jgi:hypothetical protein
MENFLFILQSRFEVSEVVDVIVRKGALEKHWYPKIL